MSDVTKPFDLDVFISYKREEKPVAQQLAEDLVRRGFDVWWDNALLAGEDFAQIVHAELRRARAVVVLWSRQACRSRWVLAEAELALAEGTLINAVIDDMAFEDIPAEFSHIQAVRLDASVTGRFNDEIARAVENKGATPRLARRDAGEAAYTIATKVRDSEMFRMIADSQHLGDFEEYLATYGDAGQFASLAKRRVAALRQAEAERKGLWRKLQIGAVALTGVVAVMANLTTILGFFGSPVPASQRATESRTSDMSDVRAQSTTSAAPAAAALVSPEIPSAIEPFTPDAAERTAEFSRPAMSAPISGDTTWEPGTSVGSYTGRINFPDFAVRVVLRQQTLISTFLSAELYLPDGAQPFAGLTGISAAALDGVELAGSPGLDGVSFELAKASGAGPDPLQLIETARTLQLTLNFAEGATGRLLVQLPANRAEMLGVLAGRRIPDSTMLLPSP